MSRIKRPAILQTPYVQPDDPPAVRNGKAHSNGKAASKPSADRFAVLNTFIDFAMGDLTRAEMATWLAIYRDTRNGKAQTSVRSIAKRARTKNIRHIQNAIARLIDLGLVERLEAGKLNHGSSTYAVKAFPIPASEEPK